MEFQNDILTSRICLIASSMPAKSPTSNVHQCRMALFLKLGFAGGMMMFLDASSFDITTAMAGALGMRSC